ncbi:MAG: dTDP-4-dehydrorhamnose reductase [Pseudomonadota bacterium]
MSTVLPKLLIFGGDGQLGRALLAQTSAFSCNAYGRAHADITDFDQLSYLCDTHEPDVVINAAAYTDVDAAEQNADTAFLINRTGAGNVARAARGAALVHISTNFVFDGTKEAPYRPYDTPNPLSVYGLSKQAGEAQVLQFHDHCMVLRASALFYEHGQNFVATMLRLAQAKKTLRVIDDQYAQPTYAGHLADAILHCLPMILAQKGQHIAHYADQPACSWYDFARAIFKTCPQPWSCQPIPSSDYPAPAQRPPNGVLDIQDFCAAFDTVQKSWQAGLDAYHAGMAQGGSR